MATSCALMLRSWTKDVLDGSRELDVYKEFQRSSADIIVRTAFGSSYLEGKRIFELQDRQLPLTVQLFQSPYVPGSRFLLTKINKMCWELEKEIRKMLKDLVLSQNKSNSEDMLVLMLRAMKMQEQEGKHSKGMNLDEIIDECKTFYFVGHETTTALLSWIIILLAMHQNWQDKARKEVLQVCTKDNYPNVDTIRHLNIVGMVLNEALRLYPPAVFMMREATKATTLGHLFIPAGTQVVIDIVGLHHDPDLWGEDANEFNPSRFSGGVADAVKHRLAFVPFGFGPRVCIGQNFAMLEAKLVIGMILQRFSFELSPSYTHAPILSVNLKPQYGAQVLLNMI